MKLAARLLPPPERRLGVSMFVVLLAGAIVFMALMLDTATGWNIFVSQPTKPIWSPIFLVGVLPGGYFGYLGFGGLYFLYTGRRPPGADGVRRVCVWLTSDRRLRRH